MSVSIVDIDTLQLAATKKRTSPGVWLERWGGGGLLCLLSSALGLFVMALAANAGRFNLRPADLLFWVALVLMVVPTGLRVALPETSRGERIGLLVALGMALYFVKVYEYPTHFAFYDEFLHWLTAQTIATQHHLFFSNTLLPISPLYPGLENFTNAISSVTGLPIFYTALVVAGVARFIMILALYLLFEMLSHSSRIAGIAILIYITSPHFLFFDAQYAYETLAIPLSILTLFTLLGTIRGLLGKRVGSMTVTWLCLVAVIVTHHITSYILLAFLALWGLVATVQRQKALARNTITLTVLLGFQTVIFWLFYAGTLVLGYLSPYLISSVQETTKLIAREQGSKQLFSDPTGQVAPLWERLTATGTTGIVLLLLPFALWQIWRHHRRDSLTITFALASLVFPASVVLRLTPVGGELASRISTLLYVPLAYVLARGLLHYRLDRIPQWVQHGALIVLVAFTLIGGAITGGGPLWARLPGPFLVSADERSISSEGIDAATWAQQYLGDNNRVATDRINQILMGTYGDQQVITEINDNIQISPLFYSDTLDSYDLSLISRANIRYLVVDQRLTTGLPRVGLYYDTGDPQVNGHTQQITSAELSKFNGLYPINHVFDSGNIEIYDVGAFANGS
jgi:hypothetical protein